MLSPQKKGLKGSHFTFHLVFDYLDGGDVGLPLWLERAKFAGHFDTGVLHLRGYSDSGHSEVYKSSNASSVGS